MIKGIAQYCANHSVELRPGSGPHKYQLWCLVCNKNIQWISAADALKITMVKQCYGSRNIFI